MATLPIGVGDVFGRWTVVETGVRRPPNPNQIRRGHQGELAAKCLCECGTVKLVALGDLRSGGSRSCGCLKAETTRARNIAAWGDPGYAEATRARLRAQSQALLDDPEYVAKHIEQLAKWNRERPGHRLSLHPLYAKHRNILHRCYNPRCAAYCNYGKRGIAVFGPFHDVAVFVAWIDDNLGPCPPDMSLDRANNDGHYEPGNLRWASARVQTINRGHGVVAPLAGPNCAVALNCFCTSQEEEPDA